MPKRFSKRKLQGVNTKTNRPIHPQPTSSKTYNPYDVLVPFTSVFLLELTVNTCRKKERPPTTLMAILNLRARSRGHASTNQTFFASEASGLDWRKMSDWLTRDHVITLLNSRWLPKYFLEFFLSRGGCLLLD